MRLEEAGVPFILVSARIPDGMITIQGQIGTRGPMICYSGGLILSGKGEILYSRQMDLNFSLEIKTLLDREFPGLCCNSYGYSKWVVDDD